MRPDRGKKVEEYETQPMLWPHIRKSRSGLENSKDMNFNVGVDENLREEKSGARPNARVKARKEEDNTEGRIHSLLWGIMGRFWSENTVAVDRHCGFTSSKS